MKLFFILIATLTLISCKANPRYSFQASYIQEYFIILHHEANPNFISGTATTAESLDDARLQLIDGFAGNPGTEIKCEWRVNSYTYFQRAIPVTSCKIIK